MLKPDNMWGDKDWSIDYQNFFLGPFYLVCSVPCDLLLTAKYYLDSVFREDYQDYQLRATDC